MNISIVVTQEDHYKYSQEICETIESSALLRGTGIAKRTPEYIQKKMENQKLDSENFIYGEPNELNHVRFIRNTIYEALLRKEHEEQEHLTMQQTLLSLTSTTHGKSGQQVNSTIRVECIPHVNAETKENTDKE